MMDQRVMEPRLPCCAGLDTANSTYTAGKEALNEHWWPLHTRSWAQEMVGKDPNYFSRWANTQEPDYLYIGCADSRVPVRPLFCDTPLGHAVVSSALHNCRLFTTWRQ